MTVLTEYARYQKIKDAIKKMGKKPFTADDIAQTSGIPVGDVESFLQKLGGVMPASDHRGLKGVFAKKGTYIQK